MNKILKKASITNIVANIFLFLIKIIVGVAFGMLSIISDAINSLNDIVTSILVWGSIKLNNKEADKNHEFGHTRAENIAGYTTGILMILLASYIIKSGIEKLIIPESIEFNYLMIAVVIITLIIKSSLYFYVKNILKSHNSPSLKANMQDHLNDVVIIIGVFIAIIGIKYGILWIDPIISIVIALYILKEGLGITLENADYLMGKKAEKKIIKKIKDKALNIKGVLAVPKILTQYLGNKIQVEIHINVNEKLLIKDAHSIGKNVKDAIENIENINSCFVHIDIYND